MLDYSNVSVDEIIVPEMFNIADELLKRNMESGRGDKVALLFQDQQLTYRQVLEQTNRLGNVLLSLGVEPENRVVLLLFDCPEAIYGMLAAMKIGAVPVPVTTMGVKEEYEYYLNDSRAKVIIIDQRLLPLLDQVRANCKSLQHVIVVGTARANELSYHELVAAASSELEAAPTHKDDMAFWLYSSGTTGWPKGIVHLHHDMVYASEAWYMRWMHGSPDDIIFSAAKIFFGFGTANSLFFCLWAGSTTVLLPDRPAPDIFLKTIDKHRATFICAAPTIYGGMLYQPDLENCDISCVRAAISAGEALPRPIYDAWEQRFGIQLLEGLGSSDAELDYIQNPPGRCKPGTVGLVVDGYQIRIVDEDGQDVPKGEVGELWLKGDSITAFYWNKHEKTKSAIIGEWLRTGDTVSEGDEGYINYVGRSDDVFKSSGIWVSPAEVEGVLVAHPQVLEAGVVGLPDKDGLLKTAAFVALKPGNEPSDALNEDLKQHVRQKLASHKVPRTVVFVPALPRTATGKIQRYKLRQGAVAEVASA